MTLIAKKNPEAEDLLDLKDEYKINQDVILKWDRYSLYIKNIA